jgi:hypothetical protein
MLCEIWIRAFSIAQCRTNICGTDLMGIKTVPVPSLSNTVFFVETGTH